MQTWSRDSRDSSASPGPAIYYGYCNQTQRFRMMNFPDYVNNVQQGVTKLMNDPQAAYQEIARGYGPQPSGRADGTQSRDQFRGRCHDCHCECCVCDSDVLLHARCGETRRIPVTFENDTRRERPVTLTLGKFVTAGGTDLQWPAQLSETQFTLAPCGEHTVIVSVEVRCGGGDPNKRENNVGTVDRCEVGYATLRAEGCTVRPTVIAVAVLPDDCDSYRRPCGDCCC